MGTYPYNLTWLKGNQHSARITTIHKYLNTDCTYDTFNFIFDVNMPPVICTRTVYYAVRLQLIPCQSVALLVYVRFQDYPHWSAPLSLATLGIFPL